MELEFVKTSPRLAWIARSAELPPASVYGIVKLKSVPGLRCWSAPSCARSASFDRMLGGAELREVPYEQELTEIELAISRRSSTRSSRSSPARGRS